MVATTPIMTTMREKITALKNLKNTKIKMAVTRIER